MFGCILGLGIHPNPYLLSHEDRDLFCGYTYVGYMPQKGDRQEHIHGENRLDVPDSQKKQRGQQNLPKSIQKWGSMGRSERFDYTLLVLHHNLAYTSLRYDADPWWILHIKCEPRLLGYLRTDEPPPTTSTSLLRLW